MTLHSQRPRLAECGCDIEEHDPGCDAEPKTERVRARNVKPYHWGVWCTVGGGEPFVNTICTVGWSEDGRKLWFGLDSHNFDSAAPDEEMELVPLEVPDYVREKYGAFVLPPPPAPQPIPVPRETLEQVREALSSLTHPVCDAVDLDDEPPCGCCDVCEGRAALDSLNRLLGGGE